MGKNGKPGELKKQNVLFLTRTMNLGGTENVVLQLCEILKPRVNKIVVCSCGGVNVERLKAMGIKHYEIPDIAGKKPTTVLQTLGKIKTVIREEQITVIHSHHRMAALYAELVAPRKMVKIANAHNVFYDKKRLTRFAYHNTKLIAVGEMVKKNLTEFFQIPEGQVCVIHNAVREFNGDIQPIEVLNREKQEGNILIGNVGRLSEQKGMRYFIEAAQLVSETHPEARFFIVGAGEEEDYLCQLVREKGLEDTVFFLGYRSDVQNVMSQLDFIVLSSLWEGLPLTPIEAFSVGKTVIGTAVDGTPEVIRDGIDGYLVEPKDSTQLAMKICFMIEHPEIRSRFEQQAKKRYSDGFSFEKLTQEYTEYYEEL